MGLFALANSFTMRVCLSMTITQMVLHAQPSEHIIGETCPDPATTAGNDTSSNYTVVYEVSGSLLKENNYRDREQDLFNIIML